MCPVARPRGELHPGADRADVGLVEEGASGQGDHGAGEVGIAGAGGDHGSERRMGTAFGAAPELDRELGLEGERGAGGRLVARGEGDGNVVIGAEYVEEAAEEGRPGGRALAAGRVEGEPGAIGE